MRSSVGLILVGAGSARRMGGIDKIWGPLGDHPVVWHSVATLGPVVDRCVLVVRVDHIERAKRLFENARTVVVAGGLERRDSVACGLEALHDAEIIAVHDVARPFATSTLLRRGIEALDRFDGAIPAISIPDTLKSVNDDGVIAGTVDRAQLRAVQTPQVFRAEALRAAHIQFSGAGGATDDAQLLEAAGYRVTVFPGIQENFKITSHFDLQIARYLADHGQVR